MKCAKCGAPTHKCQTVEIKRLDERACQLAKLLRAARVAMPAEADPALLHDISVALGEVGEGAQCS